MKLSLLSRPGVTRPCLIAAALLLSGCAQQAGWDGVFTIDKTGAAKTCVAPAASPPDGTGVVTQIQMNNDGGWCSVTLSHGIAAYESYLLVARPAHGRVFAHHVGNATRIDYTPDPGFTGTDSYSVRLIPGNAVLEARVTVTP